MGNNHSKRICPGIDNDVYENYINNCNVIIHCSNCDNTIKIDKELAGNYKCYCLSDKQQYISKPDNLQLCEL
jgi:hypothetical protein